MLDKKKKMVENMKRNHFATICKWTPGSIEHNMHGIT